MPTRTDNEILRELAERYAELAALPIQEERRSLWRAHNSLKKTRTPVLATYGMHNVWCREVFGDSAMDCLDPFLREYERRFRMDIFRHAIADDYILEPWVTVQAPLSRGWRALWGVAEANSGIDMEGGAWAFDPPIKEWSDFSRLSHPPHRADDAAAARAAERLHDAIGDTLAIDIHRGPETHGFMGDISTDLGGLRGLDQLMVDMCESPVELHRLLAFMRDGILRNHEDTEAAGHFSLTTHANQCMPYAEELEDPAPNSGPRARKDLWCFAAAQEFTSVSPRMHDEYLVRYQSPILSRFGLTAYGCCEDLSRKVGVLRQIPNLRIVAVAPRADVHRSAEAIGSEFVASWRPNPTDMVSAAWEEPAIRRILREGVSAFNGCVMHIHLKDVETLQGENDRLLRWVRIVREEIDR